MVQNQTKNYIKSLDGLRVLAVLGVFFYHLLETIVPSGYHGVSIFFVLAGFLSMNVIVSREYEESFASSIYKIFEKLKKLMPALVLVVTIVSIIMFLCFKGFLKAYPIDVISSILPFSNYAQILRNESYFDAMNSMKPLTHMWALSLEIQFYIAFYFIIYKFYKVKNKKKYFTAFAILYATSLLLAFILLYKGLSITRIYYGFDTRLSAFLIGMMASIYLYGQDASVGRNKVITICEYILFLLLAALMFFDLDTDFKIVMGITLYPIICALFILLIYKEEKNANQEKSKLYKVLSSKKMHELVRRSFIVYLVHYPLIIFINRFLAHTKTNLILYVAFIIILTIIISEILYRIAITFNVKLFVLITIDIFICLCAIFGKYEEAYVYESPVIISEQPSEMQSIDEEVIDKKIETEEISDIVKEKKSEYKKFVPNENAEIDYNNTIMSSAVERVRLVNQNIGDITTISVKDFLKYYDMKITLIGDSLAECAHGALSVYFPTSYINALGNRQIRHAVKVFEEMKEKGELGDVVVIALGTNSDKAIEVDALEKIYYAADGRPMVVLTVITPYMMEEGRRNKALTDFARSHENCYLGDWYTAMKTHYEYFMGDNTHPKGLGCDAYAQVIYKAAIKALSEDQTGKIDSEKYEYLSNAKVKDVIKYGTYYINDKDKKESIEWIVLDKDEESHTLLLLSKYAIDCKKYNLTYEPIHWGKSYLRKWLDEEFYDEAFSEDEKAFIKEKNLYNKKNPIYETYENPETKDRVFVLSYEEAEKYLDSDLLKCKGTEYFISQNGYVETEGINKGNCDWWLRTPGDANTNVMNVSGEGKIVMTGDFSTTDDFGVRPAIYVRYE